MPDHIGRLGAEMFLRGSESTVLGQPPLTAPPCAPEAWDATRSRADGASTARRNGSPVRMEAKLPWVIFLALNAVLFLRPAELVPQLEGVAIYNYLIIACLVTSFAQVRKRFEIRSLLLRPIDVCVIGLLI